MTEEGAIEILENGEWWEGLSEYVNCNDIGPLLDAIDMAIAALRAQQEWESPKPLTLDELREMDGEPVWVVRKRENADADYGYCVMNDFIAEVPGISHTWFDLKDYGKTWRAYRCKPKEGSKC